MQAAVPDGSTGANICAALIGRHLVKFSQVMVARAVQFP
jgi:hypothetical protein